MKLFLYLFLTLTLNAEFIREENVLIDTDTNIIWQDDNNIFSLPIYQEEAQLYCSNLKLNGKDDWVLPSMYELQTLWLQKPISNQILDLKFKMLREVFIWSNTLSHDNINAFAISFNTPSIQQRDKHKKAYTRCIRYSKKKYIKKKKIDKTYVMNENDKLLYKNVNKLIKLNKYPKYIWQDKAVGKVFNLTASEAKAYCSRLSLYDLHNWRVPYDIEVDEMIEGHREEWLKLKNKKALEYFSYNRAMNKSILVSVAEEGIKLNLNYKGRASIRCVSNLQN